MKLTTREILGNVCVEHGYSSLYENLSIVLCTYFSQHYERPTEDEETEDNNFWGDWVCRKTDEALDLIANAIERGELP